MWIDLCVYYKHVCISIHVLLCVREILVALRGRWLERSPIRQSITPGDLTWTWKQVLGIRFSILHTTLINARLDCCIASWFSQHQVLSRLRFIPPLSYPPVYITIIHMRIVRFKSPYTHQHENKPWKTKWEIKMNK